LPQTNFIGDKSKKVKAEDIFGTKKKSENDNKGNKAGRPKSAKSKIGTTTTATTSILPSGVKVIKLFTAVFYGFS
jgi:hypothetical protein